MTLRIAMITLMLFAALGLAADVRVSAEVDSRRVVAGESFTLTVRVEGPLRGIEAPEFPELSDFFLVGTSSSSNFSFVNGRTHNEKIYHYNLIADREGNFNIPAIPVTVKGEVYETEAMVLTVHPGVGGTSAVPPSGGPAPAPDQGSSAGDSSGQVYIRSWTDGDKIYVGEQLTHHFALYRDARVRFRGNPQYEAPETPGFWTESLGDEISGFQKIDGRDFAVTELRSALFPHEPGNLEVGAASLRVTLYDPYRDDFFNFTRGKDKILRTQAIEVEVLPLPETGRPAGFGGTVARDLDLQARLDPGPYEVGQPVTLTVTLSGYGNPRTFAMPELEMGENFRDYDSDLQSRVSVNENRIHVRKEFTWVLVPQQEGRLEIPALEYPWFDPTEGRYRLAKSAALPLNVAPSQATETKPLVFTETNQGVETLATSIHHLKTEPLLAGDGKRFPRSASFWTALALPWPVLAGAYFWRRRRDSIAADSRAHRARGAGKAARRHLKEASASLSAGDFESFCDALARGLRGYLGDRLGASAAGLSDEDIDARLAGGGVDDATRESVRALLSECDFARFAPGEKDQARMKELLARAEGLIGDLEKVKGKGRGSIIAGSAVLLLLLLLPSMSLAQQGVEPVMAEAARYYEEGDFNTAARHWETLAETGLEDSRLWYNLGGAYFQQDKIGPSILAYKRALRLAPRDKETRENLEIARARRLESLHIENPGGMARIWSWTRRTLSPGEMAVMGLVMLWLAAILTLLGILRRASWIRLRGPLLVSMLLLVFLSIGAWRAEWEDWSGREGVLMAPRVSAQSGPGADYIALFELHEGAELRLLERRGDWLRISLGAELEGWIPANSVAAL
jgi:tetratricopeptide (TPR) repeat protein